LNKKLHIAFLFFTALALLPLLSSFYFKKTEWKLVATIKTQPIQKVSIDTYSNFFIADDKGNVYKFDSLGKQQLQFSPLKKGDISLLEAWRTVNVFIFYRDLQEYIILDRFLTTSQQNFSFRQFNNNDDKRIGYARIANLALDNNLWVFDDEDFSLKKYNTSLNKVTLHTPLDLILDPSFYDLTYMREYQNLLFINDKNSGILIFDNLGNYKTKLPYKNLSYFNFVGNSIYFISENNLVTIDIYTSRQESIPMPEGKKFNYVLVGENKTYFFSKEEIEIYNFPN
jgi:hypothetical protein